MNKKTVVIPRLPLVKLKPQRPCRKDIFDYAGVAEQRTYSDAKTADDYISRQRDEWKC